MSVVPLKLQPREQVPLNLQPRPERGKGPVGRIRRTEGLLPGILYGHKQEPFAFKTEARTLERIFSRHGQNALFMISVEGQGSTIEIRLPLTLAIIDGFLVAVGASRFILPLDAVVEVIENRPTTGAVDARGRACVELRGQVLPVVSLRTLYGLDSAEPERCSVVVIQSGAHRYGVQVDQLLGQHQTVIKPLGKMFRSLRGMSGSSILGNGEVALIFDVHSLSQLAAEPVATAPRAISSSTEGHVS
jgi:ribosomal protein L25 (general stress protein Ctc)/chemotaxis signal transduction protein